MINVDELLTNIQKQKLKNIDRNFIYNTIQINHKKLTLSYFCLFYCSFPQKLSFSLHFAFSVVAVKIIIEFSIEIV